MHWHLHNFIMSRIPSDLFLIRNPSLGIETDPSGLKVVVAKKSRRLMNANKFGHAHHEKPDASNSYVATAESGTIEVTDDS